MRNAYLLITDLHYNVRKEHRVNYFSEVLSVLQQLLELRDTYVKQGYAVHAVFLGDVVDGPITNPEDAMRCLDLFSFFSSQFASCTTVLGNHEENNVSDNPFWFMVSELEDPELSKLRKPLQPQGVAPCFRVPSEISDGEVHIYFNHYGTPPKVPETTGVNIGLFHQNIGSEDICKMWGRYDDVERVAYVQCYDYLFFGHMHLATGKYSLSKSRTCVGEWLGSCVGTNVQEVENLPAKFNVPAVLVNDGVFEEVRDNLLNRSDPKTAIDYTRLELTKATNKILETTKSLVVKNIDAETLFTRVKDAATDVHLEGLVEMLQLPFDQLRYEYRKGLRAVVEEESIEHEHPQGIVQTV